MSFLGRAAELIRKTAETDVKLKLELEGNGTGLINTGIGFLDHMLTLFARHGLFNLSIEAKGDLHVDCHHTAEDVGIVLGQAIKMALGQKESIKRYGTSYVPMDESLATVSIDLSGRPYIVYDCPITNERTGNMETALFEEFFRALAFNAGMNLHIRVLYGSNAHHMIEAVFKAFGRALDEACTIDQRIIGVMSTKETLQ